MNPFAGLETGSEASDDEVKLERAKTANKGATKATKAKSSTAANTAAPLPRSGDEIKQREKKDIALQKEKKALQQKANQVPNSAVSGVKRGPLAGAFRKGDTNPKHNPQPRDRQSGTGRGKEVSKRGAGGANWGSNDGKQTLADEVEGNQIAESEKTEEQANASGEAAAPKEEEPAQPPKLTLEEYEKLKNAKRTGKGFEQLKPRDLSENDVKGKAYRKPKNTEEAEVLIKIASEKAEKAKETTAAAAEEKKEKKSVQKLEFTGIHSAAANIREPRSEAPRARSPREGDRC